MLSRGSSTATTPRSVMVRNSRPEPWASSSAACVAATDMNPLPPRAATARCRAEASGSSGRGNGILSITTAAARAWHVDALPEREGAEQARRLVGGELAD